MRKGCCGSWHQRWQLCAVSVRRPHGSAPDPEPLPAADGARLFGRDVDWFDPSPPQVRNLRVARDALTGIILHISGTNPVYGDLLVGVTSIAVLPATALASTHGSSCD
jgi:hypothetical protein